MSDTSELERTIKHDVDRLANIAWLKESGVLEEPGSNVLAVHVYRRRRNGSADVWAAFRMADRWAYGPWNGFSRPTDPKNWGEFMDKVMSHDQPIIDKVVRCDSGETYYSPQHRGGSDE